MTTTVASTEVSCPIPPFGIVVAEHHNCGWSPPFDVSFTATVTGGCPPYTYAWDFGDTGTSTESSVVHTYSASGPWSIACTATDSASGGASSDVGVLYVSCTWPEPLTPGTYFFDCPTYTRDEALEYPLVDEGEYYTGKNSESPVGAEDPRFAVFCRTPILAPFSGWSPSFVDWWGNSGGKHRDGGLFVWNSAILNQGESDQTLVISVALLSRMSGLKMLTGNSDGSLTLQVLPDCPGEIVGFKSAPYIDKLGCGICEPGDDPGDLNSAFIHLSGGPATPSAGDHVCATNPFTRLGTVPTDDLYPGESPGATNAGASTVAWSGGPDVLEWTGPGSVRFGFDSLVGGRGLRVYVRGYDSSTVMELAVGDVVSGLDIRIKHAYFGSTRVHYFGVPGDKVRWYVGRRCGDPIPFTPAYWEGGVAPDGWEDMNPLAVPSPRECLGGGTDVSGTDSMPTVSITSGP